jgi:hypothetical protein
VGEATGRYSGIGETMEKKAKRLQNMQDGATRTQVRVDIIIRDVGKKEKKKGKLPVETRSHLRDQR